MLSRMPRLLRTTLLSVRDLIAVTGPFVLIALLLLAGAYYLLDPTPPKRVVLATGPEQSDYAEFGKRYAAALKRYGIEVVLRPTQGSSENRRLLRDAAQTVDLGFVRGGSSDAARAADEDKSGVPLVSLGSLYLEPVWLFYRSDAAKRLNREATLTQLSDLRGWRVNVGARGSGVTGLVAKLLQANGIARDSLKESRLEQTPAVVALLAGELDAVVLASAPESLMVQMLLQTPGVKLFDFAQAEAYARRLPFLSRGGAAARRGGPGARPARARCAAHRHHHHAGGARGHAPGAAATVRAGGARHPRRHRLVRARRAISHRRKTRSCRWRRRPSAITATARRCCSATCRSGSPT